MNNDTAFATISERLEQQYDQVGREASAQLQTWLNGQVPLVSGAVIAQHLREDQLALIADAFYQVLPFGTGGRRGRVGYGPNRMNRSTVAMTIQGHCDYLHALYADQSAQNLSVVVANDVRVFADIQGNYCFLGDKHPLLGESSRSFAKLACEIYAGNDITAYIAEPLNDNATLSTPELSFVIKAVGAVGGVNISASHNPPDDNGIKLYDAHGSQPVAPDDQQLIDIMAAVSDVRLLAFEQALTDQLIRAIPEHLHGQYIAAYIKLFAQQHRPDQHLPIVYSPLCGTGLTTVADVLDKLGFKVLSPPDQGPDGAFSSIPFKAPNPEIAQATAPACAFADAHDVGIVLSSDPDADRVGVEVKLADGSWYHFDGNQIAAVLAYYLVLDSAGPQRKGLLIETLVTTKILREIVAQAGDCVLIDDLLVGFKYVAHVLKTLDENGVYGTVRASSNDLVLAVEESHGVIMLAGIRDKDAVPACMYLATLYQQLRNKGLNLLDYYIQILEQVGGYDNVNRSIVMQGADGSAKKERIMAALRATPPVHFAGQPVREILDYWDEQRFGAFVSESDRLPRNVLQLTTDSLVVTIRPSGTEPKLKLYCQLLPSGAVSGLQGEALLKAVRAQADQAACIVYRELLAIIDVEIADATLLLPDIIDLDSKLDFEQRVIPVLYDKLAQQDFADLEALLDWLRSQCRMMTPGTDPLPAIKQPLRHLCQQWQQAFANLPLFATITHWCESD